MAGRQARELNNFADEEDPQDKADKSKQSGWSWIGKKIGLGADFCKHDWDWDKICAYKTFKVVRIRDFKLGLTYWTIVTLVIIYVTVVAFSIEGKHQQQEPGVGTVLTRVLGKAYAGDKVFDPSDLRFPVIEPSGAFLLTRRVAVTQKRGKCVDWDAPKKSPCGAGETEKDGYCEVETWCPSLGDKNAHKPPSEATVDKVQGIDKILLKIMSGIAFPGLGNRFFVAGGTPGASNQFKNITVGELLELSDPPLKIDNRLSEYGAFVGVSFFWNCDVSGDCEPNVVIKHLDSGQGFVQKRAHHKKVNGVETREAIYMNGIRILIDSSGIGRQSSLVLAIIQIGSAIALIRVAAIVADFLMLNGGIDLTPLCPCLGEWGNIGYTKVRRDSYYKCKVRETKDYSDLQDRINLINETKKREATTRPKGTTSAGASVTLGLGAGGRGGLASAVLRGR